MKLEIQKSLGLLVGLAISKFTTLELEYVHAHHLETMANIMVNAKKWQLKSCSRKAQM